MSRMADISVAIQEWVVTALRGSQELADALDTPLGGLGQRLWDSVPPPDVAQPYVLISVVEPRDIGGVGMAEVMAVADATVQVIGEAESYEPIRPAAVAIHHALQGKANVPLADTGAMLSSQRLRSVAYPEQTGGVEYRHLGGTYRIYAQ